jgi:serine kinase of HPr protein (carbohydrate metabolism regulator)
MTQRLSSETIHASCVAINGQGVLLSGPSGCGKSDLALRLIDRGAKLVSDDYTIISRQNERLIARAPDTIRGKLEIRGVGIVERDAVQDAPLVCIFDLNTPEERMPEGNAMREIAAVPLPLFGLSPFHSSAPMKVENIVRRLMKS